MESDFGVRGLDDLPPMALEELHHADPGDHDSLPPAEVPGRRGTPPPDPSGDVWRLTWVLLGVVLGLGVMKVALFAVGGALAMCVLGAAFVAIHAVVLAAGATWFWDKRYARSRCAASGDLA